MIGQTISHYKITSKLGEGGMGEVYRAEDTTLKREVAIKVLPERFTQDDERLARFQREAQLLASLNHPNIAAIYGLEKADGVRFLVLELVEGETLAERLSKGPLPVEEALEVCRQIAEGLETAHESGVIHRDLKPANVNITPEGKVKVLDFGLAKAIEGESPAADLTHSPTRTDQMTNVGMIMGTAGYMSPEQARGQAVDKRTDIWAFGCVLFELLSGRAVHSGSTVSDILARVLERDPDWGSLPRETPDRIRQLLSRCLEKESRRRLRDIGEAVVALEDQLQGRSTETLAPTPKEHTGITPLLAAAGAVLMTLAVVWLASPWLWQRTVEGPLRKLELAVPDLSGQVDPVQISPDGQKILYGGSGRLWIRDLSQLNPREVPQSSDSHFPCWSPDSGSVAFVRDDKLWRVDLESGDHYALAPRPVDLGGGGGSVWLADGRILLVGGENSGAVEIPERGGNPQTLIELEENERDFHSASLLPDDRGILLSVHLKDDTRSIAVFDGETRKWVLQLPDEQLASPIYSPSGHILYERSGRRATSGIWAVPFSLSSLEVTGEPFLAVPVQASPSISDDGTLVFARFEERSQLVWLNRKGKIEGSIGQPQPRVFGLSLSPQGEKIALAHSGQIWIQEVAREIPAQVSAGIGFKSVAGWLSGEELLISILSETKVTSLPLGSGRPTIPIIEGSSPMVSLDGRYLVFVRTTSETLEDIWYLLLDGQAAPSPLLQTPAREAMPALSPDGRYLAYLSDESGEWEIYIMEFPGGERKQRVSVNGGTSPRWFGKGGELIYLEEGKVMAVPLSLDPRLSLGTPVMLFETVGMLNPKGASSDVRLYDLTPDGSRFLMIQSLPPGPEGQKITVIQNWFAEFKDEQ